MKSIMKSRRVAMLYSATTLAALLMMIPSMWAQETSAPAAVRTRMTVSVNVPNDKRMPQINPEDVVVKQGKERLQVTEWVPAGETAPDWTYSFSSTMPPTQALDRTSANYATSLMLSRPPPPSELGTCRTPQWQLRRTSQVTMLRRRKHSVSHSAGLALSGALTCRLSI